MSTIEFHRWNRILNRSLCRDFHYCGTISTRLPLCSNGTSGKSAYINPQGQIQSLEAVLAMHIFINLKERAAGAVLSKTMTVPNAHYTSHLAISPSLRNKYCTCLCNDLLQYDLMSSGGI